MKGIISCIIGFAVGTYLISAVKQDSFAAGRQSVLDELHAKTDSLISETDSLLFPDNAAYEAWMEEMLRRKAK